MSNFTGVVKVQRDALTNTLNEEYREMRSSGKTQVNCLLALAAKFPYRLLSPKNVSITKLRLILIPLFIPRIFLFFLLNHCKDAL